MCDKVELHGADKVPGDTATRWSVPWDPKRREY